MGRGERRIISGSPEPLRMGEESPHTTQKDCREPEQGERDWQDLGRDRHVRNPEYEGTADKERNQHQAPGRPRAPPDANEGFAEITFEPCVKEDPGHKHANKERRDPRMQPQDPREDEERRGSAPPLYTHRTARLSVERRSGGPTMATSLTAASARITSHDGSNSTRRTLNFGARGSAW